MVVVEIIVVEIIEGHTKCAKGSFGGSVWGYLGLPGLPGGTGNLGMQT